jgi:hypothetical protein
MAYYKVRIEVWCDWNPAESDLGEIAESMGVGEAICTMREVVAVVDRPQDIEDEPPLPGTPGKNQLPRVESSSLPKGSEPWSPRSQYRQLRFR